MIRDQQGDPLGMIRGGKSYVYLTDDVGSVITLAGTDGSTGYVHDGARWHNPQTGNFASQDASSYLASPANGNRFAYAADNPVNYTDPTGHFGLSDLIPWAVGAIAGAATVYFTGDLYAGFLVGSCAGGATAEALAGGTRDDIIGSCLEGQVLGGGASYLTQLAQMARGEA